VDFDALRMRRRDERLERVEPGGERFVHRKARAKAEAVAPAHDLGDDRVRVGSLGRADELVDLGLGIHAFAERIRPERAELAGGRRPSDRSDLRRKGREQAGQVPEDSRKRG
jgi:hypothetical protein